MFRLMCLAVLCAQTLDVPASGERLAARLEACQQYTEGTDLYYECTTGEAVDLTPGSLQPELTIQDEAQTHTTQRREP